MTYDSSRLRRLALISLALQSAGRIDGRTKLQKMLYLANSIGWKAIDFKYHNYGPYSESLASELDSMRNYGWIEERQISTSQDRVVHQYYFSSRHRQVGLSLIGKIEDMIPDGKKLVSKTRGLIRELNAFSSDDLQIMSTLVFLKAQDPSMSEDQVVELANKLKPQFRREEISKGRRIFNLMKDFWSPGKNASRVLEAKQLLK